MVYIISFCQHQRFSLSFIWHSWYIISTPCHASVHAMNILTCRSTWIISRYTSGYISGSQTPQVSDIGTRQTWFGKKLGRYQHKTEALNSARSEVLDTLLITPPHVYRYRSWAACSAHVKYVCWIRWPSATSSLDGQSCCSRSTWHVLSNLWIWRTSRGSWTSVKYKSINSTFTALHRASLPEPK